MGNTIVLFGSTQVGKSTLAGYLASYNKPIDEFNRDMQAFKDQAEEMGIYEQTFLKNAWISCYTSVDYDELIRPNDGRSTTKRPHSTNAWMPLYENHNPLITNIVDTIGFSIDRLNDYDDIFQATAGLILITYNQVKRIVEQNSEVDLQKVVQPLQFWFAFKPSSKVALVVSQTKCFEESLQSHDAQRTTQEVNAVLNQFKAFLPRQEIPIIPISIKTKYEDGIFRRESYNIIEQYPGIDSPCLFSILRGFGLTDQINSFNEEYDVLARPTKIFPEKNAVRICVMNGQLRNGDTVLIGPVLHNERSLILRGKIIDMRNDQFKKDIDRWPCDILSQGWVGGVKFEKLCDADNDNDDYISRLHNLKLTSTTLLYKDCGDTDFFFMNCLCIKVTLKAADDLLRRLLDAMLPKENIRLYYFGKPIVVSVVEKTYLKDDEYLLKAIRTDPINEPGFFHLPRTFKKQIQLPLLIRNGILLDIGSEKFYSTNATGTIQQYENYSHEISYRMVVNIPNNHIESDPNFKNATWTINDNEDNTRITFDNLTIDSFGDSIKKIREYLDSWYVTKCNFRIYKMD